MTWHKRYGSKFGAKKTVANGRQYDSKKEAGYAEQLELMRKAKQVLEVRPQVSLQLFAYGQKMCIYRMDFVVKLAPKCFRFDEVKGMEMPLWALKWKLLEANLNEPDFRKYNGFAPDDELTMLLIK